MTYWIHMIVREDIPTTVNKVWNSEFIGKDPILKELLTYIISARRGVDVGAEFVSLVEQNLDTVLTLNSRWLISVIDTYADQGTEIERSNATTVSLQFNQIKLCDTFLDLVMDTRINGNKLNNYNTKPLWDGMWGFNVRKGDMVGNLISRIDKNLSTTPTIHKIWRVLMQRCEQHTNSFSVLKRLHEEGLYKL